MNEDGKDLKQESHQKLFDVESASLSDGHIVYASRRRPLEPRPCKPAMEKIIPVTLQSDFDQLREHWVKKPVDYLTAVHIAPDGSKAVFTARGEVFTMPVRTAAPCTSPPTPACASAKPCSAPDGKSIIALSTQTGEAEFWSFPANGVGKPEQWTKDAKVLRTGGVISPDGKWLAHTNKDQELWLFDIKAKTDKRIAQSMNGDFSDLTWSPDSKWLAYSENADNQFQQVKILNTDSAKIETVTSNRFNSGSPAWSRATASGSTSSLTAS